MAGVVADASVIVDYLTDRPQGAPLKQALRGWRSDIHVPHLADIEVAAGVRRAIGIQRSDEFRARAALADYLTLPFQRHEHGPLLMAAWDLRRSFSIYDATYVALALALGATILTSDEKLRRALSTFEPELIF